MIAKRTLPAVNYATRFPQLAAIPK